MTPLPFSLLAYVRAKVADTWARIDSNERRIVSTLIERNGLPDSGYDPIPASALRATPLTVASPGGGGYLASSAPVVGYLQALQAQCNVLRLGATVVPLGKGNAALPRGASAITPTWLSDEVTPPATSNGLTFSSIVFTRKNFLATVTISRQQLLQSDAEDIVPAELRRTLAAAIDFQAIQGTGLLGTPLGILNTPGIETATGATLAYPSIVAAMVGIANANAVIDPDALGFMTTPTVAGLLKQRYTSAANLPIWKGSVPAGEIDEQSAYSSLNVPAGTLIHGDFSRLLIGEFSDGLQIDVDPFSAFQNAYITIRLCCSLDIQLASPQSFAAITGVT